MTLLVRAARWLAAITAITMAAGVAGWPVYVRPQIDKLRHSDAVFILGGYDWSRYPYGITLASQGWAPNLVMSTPNGARDPFLNDYCATPHPEFTLTCFLPEPSRTRGEAREFGRIAKERGWRRVIVVTFRPQISRARFILRKCFDGELIMVASPADLPLYRWIFEYGYQTASYLRNALESGC